LVKRIGAAVTHEERRRGGRREREDNPAPFLKDLPAFCTGCTHAAPPPVHAGLRPV